MSSPRVLSYFGSTKLTPSFHTCAHTQRRATASIKTSYHPLIVATQELGAQHHHRRSISVVIQQINLHTYTYIYIYIRVPIDS